MYRLVKFVSVVLIAVSPIGASIAAEKSPKLSRCDGKSRRPANAYGSILPSVDPASGTVAPASARPGGVDVFPQDDRTKPDSRGAAPPEDKVAPQIPPISAITPASDYRSC